MPFAAGSQLIQVQVSFEFYPTDPGEDCGGPGFLADGLVIFQPRGNQTTTLPPSATAGREVLEMMASRRWHLLVASAWRFVRALDSQGWMA